MEFRVVQVLWGALYTSVSPFLIGGLPKKDFVVGKCLIFCLITYIVSLSGVRASINAKPMRVQGLVSRAL